MHSMAYNNKNASRACSSGSSSDVSWGSDAGSEWQNWLKWLKWLKWQRQWYPMMAEHRQPAAVIRVIVPLKYERALFNNILMSDFWCRHYSTHALFTLRVCVCVSMWVYVCVSAVSVNKVKNNKARARVEKYISSNWIRVKLAFIMPQSSRSVCPLPLPLLQRLLQLCFCLDRYLYLYSCIFVSRYSCISVFSYLYSLYINITLFLCIFVPLHTCLYVSLYFCLFTSL